MKLFHRLFLCRTCKRIIAGCLNCKVKQVVEELVDSCAFCTRSNRK